MRHRLCRLTSVRPREAHEGTSVYVCVRGDNDTTTQVPYGSPCWVAPQRCHSTGANLSKHGEPYGTCVVVSLSPLTQTYTLVPSWASRGRTLVRRTSRCPHGGACAIERWRGRVGASALMRCVPHAVSAAIMTHIDQRRRHDCRAGIMLREVPSHVATTVAGNPRARSVYLCNLYTKHEALERRARLSTEAHESAPRSERTL